MHFCMHLKSRGKHRPWKFSLNNLIITDVKEFVTCCIHSVLFFPCQFVLSCDGIFDLFSTPLPCSLRMSSGPFCLLLALVLGTVAQKLPTRDEGLFQMQIRDKAVFHDSSVMPDGAEISGYLFRDTPKRYWPSVCGHPWPMGREWKPSIMDA